MGVHGSIRDCVYVTVCGSGLSKCVATADGVLWEKGGWYVFKGSILF